MRKAILLSALFLVFGQARAVDVSTQWEIVGTLTQNASDDSWQDAYGLGVSLNVGWFRGGVTLMNDDDPSLSPEAGVLLMPKSRTFGYAGAGLVSGDLFYRAGVYRKLFVLDETHFVIGGGLKYLDHDAPKADLQPWVSVGWIGR